MVPRGLFPVSYFTICGGVLFYKKEEFIVKMTGAQILIECLVEQGVDTVFGYPGGAVLFIYDELYKNSDRINHILTSHEQGASHAADGYARSTGRTGVCIATSGPGATNLVTGIATAYMDSVPVVFITGNVASSLMGKDSFQEADITGITMPITKNNYIVKNVESLADTIREAFVIAAEGRPGPVLVDIPKDITSAMTEFNFEKNAGKDRFTGRGSKNHPIKEVDMDLLLKLIKESQKPFIYAGGGIIKSNASEELIDFAEKLHAPVSCSLMGLGAFPSSHPQFIGLLGMHGNKATNIASSECDLFISIGARFSDRVTGEIKSFCQKAKIIHIDIDAAEIDKNVMSFHSIVGDAKNVLRLLISKIEKDTRHEWLEYIEGLKVNKLPITSGPMDPRGMMEEIYNATEGNAIIVTDVGQHQLWAAQYYKYEKPKTFISSGGFGTMGFGAGAAIGTKIGNPNTPVVHIAGDGSFRMNCNELATIEHYNLPIIIIIANNGTLGMVRQWQTMFYDKRYSQTTLDRGPDFVKLADAYNVEGYKINTLEEFKEHFTKALTTGKPTLLDCKFAMDEMVVPMVAPGGDITTFILE